MGHPEVQIKRVIETALQLPADPANLDRYGEQDEVYCKDLKDILSHLIRKNDVVYGRQCPTAEQPRLQRRAGADQRHGSNPVAVEFL